MTREDLSLRAITCRHNCHCEWMVCDKCNHYEPDPLSQQPCEDAISRKDMLAVLRQSHSLTQAWDGFEKLPSVTPKEKTGKWIDDGYVSESDWIYGRKTYKCSSCNFQTYIKYVYCPDCGCHMIEPQESEVNNG